MVECTPPKSGRAEAGRAEAERAEAGRAGSVSFDRVAGVYDETRGGLGRGREIARDVGGYLVPGTSLEVGVGTGVVALGLVERAATVVGVDISAAMLARAYQRLGPVVARADAAALPLADRAVDNVVFVHVLHLVADLTAVIAEASRVLRPGGRLVARHGMPHIEPDDVTEVTAPVEPLRHRRGDTVESVRAAAAASGLRPVATRWSSPAVIEQSPVGLAEQYEQRVFSWMWSLDDETWRATAAPVIARLQAMPEPHRPRRQVARTRLTVLERPPSRI